MAVVGPEWLPKPVIENGRCRPTELPPGGTVTMFTGFQYGPRSLTTGPDGNLWVTLGANHKIARFVPSTGAVATFSSPQVEFPGGIDAGPDGNLWFTSGNGRIGRLSTPKCLGQVARVLVGAFGTPTAGSDVIVGTTGNDVVNAGGGDDRVCGRGGNDTLRGEAGADHLDGQAGSDTLNGGSETDQCAGGPGTDSATKCESTSGLP